MWLKFSNGKEMPVELYKTRVVQPITLVPAAKRLAAINEAGYNTFQLKTKDVMLDWLTDSGVNAMSQEQWGGWFTTDDAYAGSSTFTLLQEAVQDVLGYKYVMPVHQGRAAEHLIAKLWAKRGGVVITNYHFTTTKVHIEETGGATVLELYADEALKTASSHPFKGNLDLQKVRDAIKKYGPEKVGFVRMEATTNLLGGQPFSMENMKAVREICNQHGLLMVLDGSLMCENAYLIRQREKGYEKKTVAEIVKEMCSIPDLYYMSGRKNTCVRGGLIATNMEKFTQELEPWLPFYEGFFSYGGMSMREIGAMAVGLREMVDPAVAGASIEQIKYFVETLDAAGVPVVTPPGGLACHVDARKFVPHIPSLEYPAGALTAALYIASGIRAMERGTVSMERDKSGNEVPSDLELTRLAIPRRVYSLSHIEYAIDRLKWLHQHKDLIGGLKFTHEPPVLRFFVGRLTTLGDWGKNVANAFQEDFGPVV